MKALDKHSIHTDTEWRRSSIIILFMVPVARFLKTLDQTGEYSSYHLLPWIFIVNSLCPQA